MLKCRWKNFDNFIEFTNSNKLNELAHEIKGNGYIEILKELGQESTELRKCNATI